MKLEQYQTAVTALGRDPKRDHGSVNPPIHRTSTLIFDDFAQLQAYESGKLDHPGYARHNNPTMQALSDPIAQLEGYEHAYITSSGLAATVLAILSQVGAGDHILISDAIYAHTRKFVTHELPRLGVDVTFYNPRIGDEIEALFKPNTKAIYVESPGSLTFEMQDVPLLANIAHAKGAIVISDSTWATPFHQDAPALGIDVSIQSVTKYIAGHSDLVMGSVAASGECAKKLKQFYLLTGPCPGNDNVYLALRGLRSVMARLPIHETHALNLAQWLEARSEVARVLHPALESDPGHALFKRDLTGACGLFAFELKDGTPDKIERFVNVLHHFGLGYSWGGFESLVTAYRPAPQRDTTHWDENCWLIRLNIGLEALEDLREDLDGAFKAIA
jgi:cystathionine beta-lyase